MNLTVLLISLGWLIGDFIYYIFTWDFQMFGIGLIIVILLSIIGMTMGDIERE